MIRTDDILDGYRLIRCIGAGGFGEVWLCQPQAVPAVRKALKWVPKASLPKLERELGALVRYQRVARQISKANLVPIEHINQNPEGLFYVMPLADGLADTDPEDPLWRPASLFALIESRRTAASWFASRDIIQLMVPLLEALQALSDAGLVHRDVKPDNVLLMGGQPYLGDISLIGEDAADLTARGTPGFVSPSWYLESGGHPDQYSAAALLYALLTGNSPDKMGRIAFRWPPQGERSLDPRERGEWLRLHRIVYRATHDKPGERFRDFTSMKSVLLGEHRRRSKLLWPGLITGATAAALVVAFQIGKEPKLPTQDTTRSAATPGTNADLAAAEEIFQQGMLDYQSVDLPADFPAAARSFDVAANAGHAPAQVMRGFIHFDRQELLDPVRGAQWFRKAAEQGDAFGQYNLGCCLFWGKGEPTNPEEAIRWFREAAKQGVALAQYALGYCLYTQETNQADPGEVGQWLENAAKGGLPEAWYLNGLRAEAGDGIPVDPQAAQQWFDKAKTAGYSPESSSLAVWCDVHGKVSAYARNVLIEVQRLNANNSGDALFEMDDIDVTRHEGNGKTTFEIASDDPELSTARIEQAIAKNREFAALRNRDAELWLGRAHMQGRYLQRDPKAALPWLRRAAEQGLDEARQWLAKAAAMSP